MSNEPALIDTTAEMPPNRLHEKVGRKQPRASNGRPTAGDCRAMVLEAVEGWGPARVRQFSESAQLKNLRLAELCGMLALSRTSRSVMTTLTITFPEEFREMLRAIVREEIRAALTEVPRTDAEQDAYLSVRRAAAFVDVHPDTIRAWIKAGRLSGYRAGRELRVLRSELRHFLAVGDSAVHRESPEEEAERIFARRRSR